MELYSLDEANFLINYYESKMIGNVLESSTKSIVEKLDVEDYGNGRYRVNAIGRLLPGLIKPRRNIELVAKDLNFPTPKDVLKKNEKK